MECSVQNCRECTTPSTCSICDAGYILSSGKCITCNVDHCLKCSDTDICKDCSDGYGLVGTTGKCGPCADSDCYQCALDASACTLFRKGIEAAKKQESISWWVWLIVAVVVTVALGVVAFFLFLYLSRKPIAPVTVYEVDCYDSDKGTEDEADSVVAAFHNRSFFARPPPIYLVYHYVRPRVITQDTVEIHGDLESVSGADITSSSEAGESKSQTSDCDISER
ncbi:hypothetical protein, conserved [Angomonas deanei]|uniref:Uncharacterized protein n=1 Tax=Angomonas deanei TaxID=59799 RepID=A0A7G2CU68_9TRYP|nr:hypothetical protein, conserved [Angomonas deanei]